MTCIQVTPTSLCATGFIGNVALKVSEGMVDVFKHMLQESLAATLTRRIGYLLSGRLTRI